MHCGAEMSSRLQELLNKFSMVTLCSFNVVLNTPTNSHSHNWMFNSYDYRSVITWCCSYLSAKIKSTRNTAALRYLLQQNTVSLDLCSYSGIPVVSFSGHLLLHFLESLSDLWTARRSGVVQKSRMQSRKLSRRRPGNKASIPVYLKPWMKVPADFLKSRAWVLVPAARWEGSNHKTRVTSGILALGIP